MNETLVVLGYPPERTEWPLNRKVFPGATKKILLNFVLQAFENREMLK